MKYKVILVCILILIVILWYFRLQSLTRNQLKWSDGDLVRIRGYITSQPYHNDTKQIFKVDSFQVETSVFPEYFYGDQIEIVGTLRELVINPLIRKYRLMYPDIRVLTMNNGETQSGAIAGFRWLMKLRQKLMQQFQQNLPEPQASLLSGIVLGERSSLPKRFEESLRYSGTIHVIVASGYNVMVVSAVLLAILTLLISRFMAIPFLLFGIFIYTFIAGADPPVVRAAFMGSLAYLAQILGREYQGMWALGLASALMMVFWPLIIFDVGFQLSVAATVGILMISPMLRGMFTSAGNYFPDFVRENVYITLGAQIAVQPLLFFHFHSVSAISLLANLLITSLVPLIMGMGGVLLFGLVLPSIFSRLIAALVWVPLSAFVLIVELCRKVPFGYFVIERFDWYWVVVWYACLLLVYLVLRKRTWNKKKSNDVFLQDVD